MSDNITRARAVTLKPGVPNVISFDVPTTFKIFTRGAIVELSVHPNQEITITSPIDSSPGIFGDGAVNLRSKLR